MDGKGLDPYGFARYQGEQKEREAVLHWLSKGAATATEDAVQMEYFYLMEDIREERHRGDL